MTANRRRKIEARTLAATTRRSYTHALRTVTAPADDSAPYVPATLTRDEAGAYAIVVHDPREPEPITQIGWAMNLLADNRERAVDRLDQILESRGWKLAPGQSWPTAPTEGEVPLLLRRNQDGRNTDLANAIYTAAGLGWYEIQLAYAQAVAAALRRRGAEVTDWWAEAEPREATIRLPESMAIEEGDDQLIVRWREGRGWILVPSNDRRAAHGYTSLGLAVDYLALPEDVADEVVGHIRAYLPEGEPLPAWTLKPGDYDPRCGATDVEGEVNPQLDAQLAAYLTHPGYLELGGDHYGLALADYSHTDPAACRYSVIDRTTGEAVAHAHGVGLDGHYTDAEAAWAIARSLSAEHRAELAEAPPAAEPLTTDAVVALLADESTRPMVQHVAALWSQQGITVNVAGRGIEVRGLDGTLLGVIDVDARGAAVRPAIYRAVIRPEQYSGTGSGMWGVAMPGGFLPDDPVRCAAAERRRWVR